MAPSGGWTASDIVGPVQDIADLGYAIYGPRSETSLITPENISMMVDPRQSFYGYGIRHALAGGVLTEAYSRLRVQICHLPLV